jgi:YbgC/YbaW family acyl-CoA thioester hydrolase
LKPALGPSPSPETPVFECFVRVRFHEVDSLGHVNNAVYLEYLEQAAVDHAVATGLDVDRLGAFGGVFVARRHEIVYLRPAYADDILRIVTWLDEPNGARVTRHYLISKDVNSPCMASLVGKLRRGREVSKAEAPIVQASTEWVFASEEGRPRRIPSELMQLFKEPLLPDEDRLS